MSVFSILKRSRQQAKEHAQKQADKAKEEAAKPPYRHVPTHAAIDAMSGAPSGWRQDDRVRILEQNRRRSAMTASGLNMSTPGIPRVASSLSQVTYPSAFANPVVGGMPRAYSYSGVPPMPTHLHGWPDRSAQVVYSVPESAATSIKGKEVDRLPVFDSGRAGSTSGKGSPVDSSNASTSSQDDLEMKPNRPTPTQTHSAPAVHPALRNAPSASSGGSPHRLHPSNSRRASDASIDRSEAGSSPRAAVDRRPPPSTRGFSAIPAVNALPPMHFGSLSGSLAPSAPSVASSSASTASGPVSVAPSLASFNFSTGSSAPTSAHTSAQSSISIPSTPAANPQFYDSPFIPQENVAHGPALSSSGPILKHKDRRVSKVTRFTEDYETNRYQPVQAPQPSTDRLMDDFRLPASSEPVMKLSEPAVVAPAPVPVEELMPVQPPTKSGKRLSKQPGGKLTKKNRWSSKAAPITA